jgi:hypothetical protein
MKKDYIKVVALDGIYSDLKYRRVINIKMDLREIRVAMCGMDLIGLA